MVTKSNYPPAQISAIDGQEFVSETIESLMQLGAAGRPETDADTEARINQYFEFCQTHKFRPGIESLAKALGTTRKTLCEWEHGRGCSAYKQELIVQAKQTVLCFLEQCGLQGRINPATLIFALKNWSDYTDNQKTELPYIPVQSTDNREIAQKLGLLVTSTTDESNE